MQPVCYRPCSADVPRLAPPTERIEPLTPAASHPEQRPNVEHCPVQEPSVGGFPLLFHSRLLVTASSSPSCGRHGPAVPYNWIPSCPMRRYSELSPMSSRLAASRLSGVSLR